MEDILSNLPHHLLCNILSKLSTKDSVRTSVLSSCWRSIWSHVPALDLDCQEDDLDLWEFLDKFMNSNPELVLERFKLIYYVEEHSHGDFVWRLNEVIKSRVIHLTIQNMAGDFVRMPVSLYSCTTLVDLTLYRVVFDCPGSELVSLPSVKTLYLEAVKFDGYSVLKTLISSCSILEDLTMITDPDDDVEVVCIRSHSLRCLKLESRRFESDDPNVEIDTPRLEYMSIGNYRPERFIIQNIGQYAKLKMDVVFDVDHPLMIPNILNFIIGISKFQEMTISAQTLKSIHGYYYEVETLPQFSNLSRLNALLVDATWEALQVFLSCCMNLHSLILELDRLPDMEEIRQSPLPQCIRSSLQFVKLKASNTQGLNMLATYFRKNCPALKKMILSEG